MEEKEVHERLRMALNLLVEKDSFLLEMDVNERSISHKLGNYLGQQFEGWDVDCEYNRVGQDHVKKTVDFDEIEQCYKKRNTDSKEVAVYPDVIIHRRGEPNNLAVLEVKRAGNENGKDCDLLKLQKYKEQLGYAFTFFIEFAFDQGASYRVFDEKQNEIALEN